ncbi:MAG: DNA-processing protein DprA, partial [bacterium]
MQANSLDPEILLRLSAVPGVGSNKLRALISRFGATGDIFKASINELACINGIDRITAERIKDCHAQDFARAQFRKMKKCGVRFITFWDAEYPRLLKQIYDPPAFLFIKGTLEPTDKDAIGIVGTRRPTAYGKIVTERLTSELAQKGLTIVSGLAYGIDTLAHKQALQSGSRTLAILGSGVDVIYPYENKKLSEKIISNGAIISEFPMGTEPDRNNFPRRNRIICGLSLGVVVIEAGTKSGALITAALALDQNREVFAVPGNIDNPKSIGTNELIKQGAKVVTSAEDIFAELSSQLDISHNKKP